MQTPKPVRPTESRFYRYSGLQLQRIDWLKTILIEHELYLPSVKELNDPADGRPLLAPLSEAQIFEFLYSRVRNPTLSPEAQAKVIETLRHNVRAHGQETIQREMATLLNKHTEEYRIYSMSKRYDNLALWAKYGDDHSGYCLEFANEGELFVSAVEVVYGETVPLDVTNPEQRKGYFFYCKRKEWSTEEEIRLILMRGKGTGVKIDPRWITRIILGMNISDAHEKTIRGWAEQREPNLVVVKAYFDNLDQTLKLRGAEG